MDASEYTSSSSVQKHQWNTIEDAKLIECLLDMVNSGKWKVDIGSFKVGYLQQLEKMLDKKLPRCGIKAQLHIDSHVKLWKKQCHTIFEMLGPHASGFGRNNVEKCIIAEKDVFNEWVKSHQAAKGLRNKPFPYYDELSIVYKKDHANGHGVRGLGDVIDKIDREILDGETNLVGEDNDNEQHPMNEDDVEPNNPSPPIQRDKKRRRTSKIGNELVEALIKTINKFADMYSLSIESMNKISNCFQNEVKSHTRRISIFAKLKEIHGLKQEQVL